MRIYLEYLYFIPSLTSKGCQRNELKGANQNEKMWRAAEEASGPTRIAAQYLYTDKSNTQKRTSK